MPTPPLEDCAYCARLRNRSVFILDLRLESTPACGLPDFPTPACCFNRIHCSKLWRTEVTNNVFTSQVQRSLESNIPSYMKAYYWSIEPVLFCFLAFDLGEGWSSDSHKGLREGKVKNWAFFGVVGTNILLSCAVVWYRYCSMSFGLFTIIMAIGDHNISNANKLDQPDCLSVEQAWINGGFFKENHTCQ